MKDRGVISATPRQQMWRQLCAQRPRLGIVVAVLWVARRQPRNQFSDGILRRTICLRPRSGHRLHEAMDRHRRSAVLERVVLHERNFGNRRECFHALHFVFNRALHQRHRDALVRALGEVGHQPSRRACPSSTSANSTRGCLYKYRSRPRVIGEPHLRALAVGRCMVESEW